MNDDITEAVRLSRGRRFSREQREDLLARFRASGLSQREFVVREGIGLSTLSKWVRTSRGSAGTKSEPVKFQEMVLPMHQARWAVEVVNPQNWTVRFSAAPAAGNLQQLLRALPC